MKESWKIPRICSLWTHVVCNVPIFKTSYHFQPCWGPLNELEIWKEISEPNTGYLFRFLRYKTSVQIFSWPTWKQVDSLLFYLHCTFPNLLQSYGTQDEILSILRAFRRKLGWKSNIAFILSKIQIPFRKLIHVACESNSNRHSVLIATQTQSDDNLWGLVLTVDCRDKN